MPEDKIQCRLVLDSCCDLPVEIINNAKVDLLEFPFNMNDGEHFDDMWKTMSSKEFYDRMRKGEVSGTAQVPSPKSPSVSKPMPRMARRRCTWALAPRFPAPSGLSSRLSVTSGSNIPISRYT